MTVEPLAAALFNTLLSSRSTLLRESVYPPSLRAAARSMRSTFPPDFFIPSPRLTKGKEKAADLLDTDCGYCQETAPRHTSQSSCVLKHSLWCPRRNRLLMTKEIIPRRIRRQHQVSYHESRRYSSTFHSLSASAYAMQVQDPSQSLLPPITPEDTSRGSKSLGLHNFRTYVCGPSQEFDLETAWNLYQSVEESGALPRLSVNDLLVFAEKCVSAADVLCNESISKETLKLWGDRLQTCLEALKPRVTPLSRYDSTRTCLLARAMALSGNLRSAVTLAREVHEGLFEGQMASIIQIYTTVVLVIRRFHDNMRVLDFIVAEWNIIGTFFSARYHRGLVLRRARAFRQTAISTMGKIEFPAVVLAERQHLDKERRQRMGELLLEVMCEEELGEDAYDIYEEMKRQSLAILAESRLKLVRTLVRGDAFQFAATVFSEVTASLSTGTTFKAYLSTALFLYAHQGDITRSEEQFHILEERGWVSLPDISMIMRAHAHAGHTDQTVSLFETYFGPRQSEDEKLLSPTISHYNIIIFAFAQRGDFASMNFWLEKMANAGMKPNVYVYTIILKSFAMRGDVTSVAAVLDQMREAQVYPNVVSYTVAITLLAHRKDPIAAEALYKRAIKEGVVPDRKMTASLMNAHVEAGSWQGVIRAFDYLMSSPSQRSRSNISVYNTLLKAYVRIGAPFRIVSSLFSKLEAVGVRPNSHTFALLIQSACDAGQMDIAWNIFCEMDQLAGRWNTDVDVNVFVMTILMTGFLRLGDKTKAKIIYDDMRERNIQPSSVTFHAILKAYGRDPAEGSLEIAEAFLQDIMRPGPTRELWLTPSGGKPSRIGSVYGALMSVYVRQRQPEDVERLLEDMLQENDGPTLGTLTLLLDAYRRTENIEAATKLWPQIFELGMKQSQTDVLFKNDETVERPDLRRQSNLLCVPLSIFIDVLSAHGRHLEIPEVWQSLKAQGFSFDSHNWNHLAVALVRAGEPIRAFDILERIILPYQRQSEDIVSARNEHPETPYYFNTPYTPPEEDSIPEPALESVRSSNRPHEHANIRQRSGTWLEVDEQHADDFAHPFNILRQISPSWNMWAPHKAVLSLLSQVLGHLEAGLTIQPLSPGEDINTPRRASSLEQKVQQRRLANEILLKIREDCPHAVDAVTTFEQTVGGLPTMGSAQPQKPQYKYSRPIYV